MGEQDFVQRSCELALFAPEDVVTDALRVSRLCHAMRDELTMIAV